MWTCEITARQCAQELRYEITKKIHNQGQILNHKVNIILIHELFACLYKYNRPLFRKLFLNEGANVEFWDWCERVGGSAYVFQHFLLASIQHNLLVMGPPTSSTCYRLVMVRLLIFCFGFCSTVCLSVCLSVCLPICQSVCLCLSVFLILCLFTGLYMGLIVCRLCRGHWGARRLVVVASLPAMDTR